MTDVSNGTSQMLHIKYPLPVESVLMLVDANSAYMAVWCLCTFRGK
jgi:hypothetical protein